EQGFILPVEIAAVLLLAAIVGAIVIAREKDK
ncbi:MAG TPA: NADH-quinone oxidoreductase subunit J, partial [Dehalococcoidia bacterium]|nr:NADH-quinone oxidoreductase subunit J [Dehalococcoidia bacterium]